MKHLHLRALLGATLICALSAGPAAAQSCVTTAAAQPVKPKKKGFGLGGLLKAARNAGVGDMLGAGNMLGDGKLGQVAGAVAGTAVNGTGAGGAAGLTGMMSGLVSANPIAQLAGAATGTVAELARSTPRNNQASAPAVGSACVADTGAIVNLYK